MPEVPHLLLAPLSAEQQLVVDLLAEAFLAEDYQWPVYDHLEWQLDQRDLDTIKILQSFPSIGAWNYGAIAWNGNDSGEAEVALTVVGMWHAKALREYVPVFFELIDFLAAQADLIALVDHGAIARVAEAIKTLEAIIALRDAGQHPEASDRAVRAAEHLHIPFQPDDFGTTWKRISTQATNALNAIREELNAVA